MTRCSRGALLYICCACRRPLEAVLLRSDVPQSLLVLFLGKRHAQINRRGKQKKLAGVIKLWAGHWSGRHVVEWISRLMLGYAPVGQRRVGAIITGNRFFTSWLSSIRYVVNTRRVEDAAEISCIIYVPRPVGLSVGTGVQPFGFSQSVFDLALEILDIWHNVSQRRRVKRHLLVSRSAGRSHASSGMQSCNDFLCNQLRIFAWSRDDRGNAIRLLIAVDASLVGVAILGRGGMAIGRGLVKCTDIEAR